MYSNEYFNSNTVKHVTNVNLHNNQLTVGI